MREVVAEDDYVVATNNEHVAQLFAVSFAVLLLIVEQVGIGPQIQEGLLAQVGK